ncbi:E3 ubiquitin- ligase listerin [Brachionus plicatilis]|uniref:E3 ubiquitin-protein ligase listerin n=1 Tax=Brachionus plicatilis TaxID=10195 RepID=A0A3M7QM38_BRAPC|nr:E3 ubiquitin- ligase listerin [Brachionus plicatilis]
MGKKQGEAARVKGNAKPSSSAKAAEMLTKVPNYSFGSDMPLIGKGTFLEESFDSNVDPDFRMLLRKLTKKDNLTKSKTLEELKNLIDTKTQEDCINIVSYWAKSFTKLSIENDRKIRELCQQTHEKLCAKVNKHLAPHIKTIMPFWLIAQCDSHLTAARIAESSFKSMFNEQKQPEVIYFCRDEIMSTIQDFLLVQSPKTLSDMKNTSEDEAVQKYENVLAMVMRAFGLYLKYLFTENSKVYQSFNWASLEKILLEPKFFKYSKDSNQKTRANFFYLSSNVINFILLNKNLVAQEQNEDFTFRKNLRAKLIPLVFYALDEDNELSCQFIWKSIVECLTCSDLLEPTNIWSLINVKKAFIPKLISLLRNHGNGSANSLNIETIYPCLSHLLKHLRKIFDSADEKFSFYREFLAKINDLVGREFSSVPKIRFANVNTTRSTAINAYFESVSVILDDIQTDQGVVFFEEILNQVTKTYEAYLKSPIQTIGFEQCFNKFLQKIDCLPSEKFKSDLNELLITLLKSDQNLDKQFSILRNYLATDLKNSQLLNKIFQFYLDKIEDCLPIINYLVRDFYDSKFLDLIIHNEPESGSVEKYLEKLFSNNSNLVQKTIFYCQICIKQNQQQTLNNQLDKLIFTADRSQESIDIFMQELIDDILKNKICQQLCELFIKWIKSSEKIKNFVHEFLLKNLEINSVVISELNSILKDKQFTLSLLEIIYDYLKNTRTLSDQIVVLNLDLLDQELPEKLNLLWNMLVEYFRFKLKENLNCDNVNNIINKLINLLISENSLDQFRELILIKLNDGDDLIVKIVEQIQIQIQTCKDSEFVKNFSQSISLADKLKFEKILFDLLNNSDLISKLYLDNRYNYLFTELYSQLIIHKKPDPEWLSDSNLNKITFSLSQFNFALSQETNFLHHDWYHLILSSILIDKFYTGTKNVCLFRSELHSLFFEKNFIYSLVENLTDSDDFVANNFQPSTIISDLNKFSLLLTYLIDLKYDKKIESVVKNFMVKLSQTYPDEEESIKLFLMDVPFAKQSIMDNLEFLVDNIDHYYYLFESVLQQLVLKLEELTHALDILNKDQHVSLLEFNLNKFSFILNILSKYVTIYFDFLKEKNDSKLDVIFKSEKTIVFMQTKLSDYMKRVLDFFIKLKESINKNLDVLVQNLSLEQLGSGYFFYFNYSTEPQTRLNWEELNFGIKLNSFLGLFFDESCELSSHLNNQQWDFLLCYSSAMSHRLKSPLTQNKDKLYLNLASVKFYQYLHQMIEYLNFRLSDSQIRTDWREFFSKEILDPVLIIFTNLAQSCELDFTGNILLNTISNLMGEMSYDRLLNHELEPKFNVMDLDVSFSDKIKTIFNYFVPFLKYKIAPIQLGAYKVLRVFMLNIDSYFTDENSTQIVESLPFVFKETFFQLTDLFSDLKKSFEFEHSILSNEENLTAQTNNHIMSFLLINKLVLDMFSSNNLQFKSKLATDLRELNFSDYLMNCLFRLMEKNGSEKFTKSDEDPIILEDVRNFFDNKSVELFACRLYKQALKMCPAMIRDWWNMQPKRVSDQVDKFTAKYVSPILIEEEIRQINRSANMFNSESESEEESSIKIKGMTSTREVVSTYKMKELSMDLLIQLPVNYPLGVVSVSSAKRLGVSENEWRNWLLQLTTYLTHQNGSIIQGLQIWKRNVDKKFAGVEECTICYSVIHGTNYQLPKMKCRTCKHMFHSVCLYKWFESSSKSSCPLCRNLF